MMNYPDFKHLLVIPRLRVQNANAISSPSTHGFPGMTAFLGLMWALERKTAARGLDLRFRAVGVVCHDVQEQTATGGFIDTFCLTRNPVDKDGGTMAIIEEGRIHLDLSLVFAIQSNTLSSNAPGDQTLPDTIAGEVRDILTQMRIAGGSIVPSDIPLSRQVAYIMPFTGDEEDCQKQFQRLKYRLLPGFTLVARDDLLEQRYQELLADHPSANRLDAWLSLSRVNWHWNNDEEKWQHDRQQGWIVPVPVGYGNLSGPHEPGTVANARDMETPFCFVESLYSIGQWISPHRLQSLEQLLWYADHQAGEGLYRCRNDYTPNKQDEPSYLDD
jgi:CRISPR-associated protein Csy2